MKIAIFLGSFTGNNADLAHKIRDQLKRYDQSYEFVEFNVSELAQGLTKNTDFKLPSEFDAFMFGCFTDCFVPPPFVRRVLEAYPEDALRGKFCLLFNAHGGDSGFVIRELKRLVEAKGALPVAQVVVKYCNNYPGLTYPKNDREIQGILSSGFSTVQPGVEAFHKVLAKQEQAVALDLGLGNRFGATLFSGMLRGVSNHMGRKWTIDNDKCIKCEKCVKICPNACYELKDGRIIFDGRQCEGCLGCFQTCPKHAIFLEGGKMRETPQYHFASYQIGETDKFIAKQ